MASSWKTIFTLVFGVAISVEGMNILFENDPGGSYWLPHNQPYVLGGRLFGVACLLWPLRRQVIPGSPKLPRGKMIADLTVELLSNFLLAVTYV